MRRREFLALIASSTAIGHSHGAFAQEPGRMRRVGVLLPYPDTDPEYQMQVQAFRDELRRRGWVEGKTVQFDVHWATDNMDRVRNSAAALSASHPDVLLTLGGRVIPILAKMAPEIPMVIPGAADPVGLGIVQSLAHPGRNITGFTFLELSQFGKALEVLIEIAPPVRRVLMINNPDNPSTAVFKTTFEAAAGKLGLEAITIPVHHLSDIDRALGKLAGRRDTGIFYPPDVTINRLRSEVIALAAKYGLPAIYPQLVFVKTGGLVSYGVDRTDLWRRAAEYVDRILKGENASDLPFQQPTKYQLSINLRTAQALGLHIPLTLQTMADEVIE